MEAGLERANVPWGHRQLEERPEKDQPLDGIQRLEKDAEKSSLLVPLLLRAPSISDASSLVGIELLDSRVGTRGGPGMLVRIARAQVDGVGPSRGAGSRNQEPSGAAETVSRGRG